MTEQREIETEPKEEANGEEATPGPEAKDSEKGESLEEKLRQTEEKLKEAEDRCLRLQADFENSRKRMAREKADFLNYGYERILTPLLPLLDDLERSMEAAKTNSDLEGLVKGVELVTKEFMTTLEKMGVSRIATVGEKFDPNVHEAVGQEERDDQEPDTVVNEIQKGYKLKDRLLRAARVIVSKKKSESDSK